MDANHADSRELWGNGLTTVGAAALLFGAIDPLEGSIVILVGSAFMALGALVRRTSRRDVAYRTTVFALIVIGVAAVWGLSAVGGLGGTSGHSMWWALLVLPYVVGWVMGILGRDSPRWLLWAGGVVALWYLALPALMLRRAAHQPSLLVAPLVMAVVGLVTLVGCYLRLRRTEALTQ